MRAHDHHQHDHAGSHAATTAFPTDHDGLPASGPTQTIDLADGEETELRIQPVAKRIGDATFRLRRRRRDRAQQRRLQPDLTS